MADLKVLIIEANEDDARGLERLYVSWGFEVLRASEGQSGVALAREATPSLILLAVELPGLSGYTTCGHIKRESGLQPIPLFITSTQATAETFEQHKALRFRAEEYLHKPLAPKLLKQLTEQHLHVELTETALPEPPQTSDAAEEELLFDEPEVAVGAEDDGLMEVLDDISFFGQSDEVEVDNLEHDMSIGEIDFDEPAPSDEPVTAAPSDEPATVPPSEPVTAESSAEPDSTAAVIPEAAAATATAETSGSATPLGRPGSSSGPGAPRSRPTLPPISRPVSTPGIEAAKQGTVPRFNFPSRPSTGVIPRIATDSPAPDNAATDAAIAELKQHNAAQQTQLADLQAQLEVRDEELSSAKAALGNAEKLAASLKQQIDTLKDIEATQQSTIERQHDEIGEMRGQLVRLGEQLAASADTASADDSSALRKEFDAAQQQVSTLVEENNILQSTVISLENELTRVHLLIGPVRLRDFLLAMQEQLTQTIGELDSEIASADQIE